MTQDGDKIFPFGSGTNGGTGGTGPTEATTDAPNAPKEESKGDSRALSAGDNSIDDAIGGGARVNATEGGIERSGRLSAEGTERPSDAPDAGSPGGMGGATARMGTAHHRPPGGVSPMATDGDDAS